MQPIRVLGQVAMAVCSVALFFGSPSNANSPQSVREAERLFQLISQRYEAGTASSTDVAEARYYLSDMKYRTGIISKMRHCRETVPILRELDQTLEARFREASQSSPSVSDLIAAKRAKNRLELLCG